MVLSFLRRMKRRAAQVPSNSKSPWSRFFKKPASTTGNKGRRASLNLTFEKKKVGRVEMLAHNIKNKMRYATGNDYRKLEKDHAFVVNLARKAREQINAMTSAGKFVNGPIKDYQGRWSPNTLAKLESISNRVSSRVTAQQPSRNNNSYNTHELKKWFEKMVADLLGAAERYTIQSERLKKAAKSNPDLAKNVYQANKDMQRAYELYTWGAQQLQEISKATSRNMKVPNGPIRPTGYHNYVKPEIQAMEKRFQARNRHLPTPTNWTNIRVRNTRIGPVVKIRHLIKEARRGGNLGMAGTSNILEAREKATHRAKRHTHLMNWERNLLTL